jgi:hypothetical protein
MRMRLNLNRANGNAPALHLPFAIALQNHPCPLPSGAGDIACFSPDAKLKTVWSSADSCFEECIAFVEIDWGEERRTGKKRGSHLMGLTGERE